MAGIDEPGPRQRFAEELRSARELYPERQLSQTALARKIKSSKSTISRLEGVSDPIPPGIPALLDQVFDTDGLFKKLYEEITAESFPNYARKRIELEPKATAILEWSPTVVPGLFQTGRYADCLFRSGNPRLSEKELASMVAKRLARQRLLESSPPPDFSVVVCESVILRGVGGPEVMREQLEKLLSLSRRPTTVLQVLPLAAGTHGLMDASLSILDTPQTGPIVYTEGIRSSLLIDEPTEVAHFRRAYDVLTATALSRDESTRLIRKHLETL
ncbi:Scr1 family TA system antitoxin-like transcriptional regulator [Streptomyces sp. NPDC014685]|uniref:helix-turn-helix domain-containing protein n=1 Tax=Streptomyces sp. NPDC014685 TaxID=3364881 RepID=UPI0036F8E0B2